MRPTPRILKTPSGPVSEWDVGRSLAPGEHYIPGIGVRTAEALYEEDKHKAGRPLRFTLAQARKIKSDYWTGRRTIARMAVDYHCTEVTISRVVHAKTYWYT